MVIFICKCIFVCTYVCGWLCEKSRRAWNGSILSKDGVWEQVDCVKFWKNKHEKDGRLIFQNWITECSCMSQEGNCMWQITTRLVLGPVSPSCLEVASNPHWLKTPPGNEPNNLEPVVITPVLFLDCARSLEFFVDVLYNRWMSSACCMESHWIPE